MAGDADRQQQLGALLDELRQRADASRRYDQQQATGVADGAAMKAAYAFGAALAYEDAADRLAALLGDDERRLPFS